MREPKFINAEQFVDKYGDWHTEEGTEIGFVGPIKDLVELMPAVYIPRWIPVTERLPEEGSYLCTENHLGTIFVDVSCFDGKQWCLPNGDPHFMTKVLAWMPLPEPYKEGEEE